MTTLPSIFISHGAPMVALDNSPAREFLSCFGGTLQKPKAIVVISAHWEHKGEVLVTSASEPATIHDFGNFDRRLTLMRYPAPGDPALANKIVELVRQGGFEARLDPHRGFDHGVWIPLILMYPNADIPVVEISIDPWAPPSKQLELGRALRPLRGQGVLVIGSGSLTHNLHEFRGQKVDSPAPSWVQTFGEWVENALTEGRLEDLLSYRALAPYAVENHPMDEHFMPLFAAIGAGGTELKSKRLHHSHSYGVLAMDAYSFD